MRISVISMVFLLRSGSFLPIYMSN